MSSGETQGEKNPLKIQLEWVQTKSEKMCHLKNTDKSEWPKKNTNGLIVLDLKTHTGKGGNLREPKEISDRMLDLTGFT